MSLPSEEQWRAIPDWEGSYEASDQGRVRSVTRTIVHTDGRRRTYLGQVLAEKVAKRDGRARVILKRPGQASTLLVHALVLSAFAGSRPSRMVACHNNGDHTDNRLANLRWATQSDNMYDAVEHGVNTQANKVRCPQGHLLASPNLVPSLVKLGQRSCLACSRAHGNANYAKRTGRPYDFEAWADAHYARIMEAADLAIHHTASRPAA